MTHNAVGWATPTPPKPGKSESGYLVDLRADNLTLRWLVAEARAWAEEAWKPTTGHGDGRFLLPWNR